jgi:hypothetical protein
MFRGTLSLTQENHQFQYNQTSLLPTYATENLTNTFGVGLAGIQKF